GSLIKLSNRFGIKIIPIGNGSTFKSSFKPSDNSVYLSMQRLNNVIEVDKNNLFIELQAGCNWKNIFGNLKNEELYFPIEIESVQEKRTVGGIFSTLKPSSIASNYFTSIEFFAPDGTQIRYGCKTLKNVSGYDLVKFMSGSFGKFGVITSLILRLLPSNDNFFKNETISKACSISNDFSKNAIFKRLVSELDPNSVFE
ncbi:MAG: FAD-binding oxidoreductase, partial [Candidatus Delongbacteria bacterium]|nr:FAD-binding oxidoreductase [Candidatus Delongbacteria bacterium]